MIGKYCLLQSTGDSLDEVDNDSVQRSAAHSEIIDADNPQTPEEVMFTNYCASVIMPSPTDRCVEGISGVFHHQTVATRSTKLRPCHAFISLFGVNLCILVYPTRV